MDDGKTLLSSAISQNANSISLKVSSSDFTGKNIVSKINLLNGTALIEAKNIDLVGKVTFNMLSNDAISGVQPDLSGYASKSDIPDVSGFITKQTVIAGGLVATNFILSTGAKIGGYIIDGDILRANLTYNNTNYGLRLDPSYGLNVSSKDTKQTASIGLGAPMMQLINQSTTTPNQTGAIIECDSNNGMNYNLILRYNNGWANRETIIGYRHFNDASDTFKRLLFQTTSMPFENQVQAVYTNFKAGHAVYWDEGSGVFYVK